MKAFAWKRGNPLRSEREPATDGETPRASRRALFPALLGGAVVAGLATEASAGEAPYPRTYSITPYLDGSVLPPLVTYRYQHSSVWAQKSGDGRTIQWTAYLNLRWDDIPATSFGRGVIFLSGLPPIGLVMAGTGFCDWGGNFEGFAFAPGGNFSMDTDFDTGPAGKWFLVGSFANQPPINLEWPYRKNPGNIALPDATGKRPGRLRGRIDGCCDANSFETAMAAMIASGAAKAC